MSCVVLCNPFCVFQDFQVNYLCPYIESWNLKTLKIEYKIFFNFLIEFGVDLK